MPEKNEEDKSNITFTTKISNIYDESGEVIHYHVNKYMPIIDTIISYFKESKPAKDLKLLDIGIGYGAFLKLCQDNGFEKLYGMDPFPTSIEITTGFVNIEAELGKIEKLPWPFEKGYFDIITCLDVVEHLEDPGIFFENVKEYINDNGIIIVRTPNGEIAYSMRNIPYFGIRDDNPTHINVHNPQYWKALAEKHGYKLFKCWKGESLTHLKHIHYIKKIFDIIQVDHRKAPLINKFEQAFIMIIRL